MPDLTSLLGKKSVEATPPKQLDNGLYYFLTQKYKTIDATAEKNGSVVFTFSVITPVEVDPGANEGITFPVEFVHYQTLTEKSLFRLKKLLDDMGIEEADRTLAERLVDSPNKAFKGMLNQQPSGKAGDNNFYAKLTETYPSD